IPPTPILTGLGRTVSLQKDDYLTLSPNNPLIVKTTIFLNMNNNNLYLYNEFDDETICNHQVENAGNTNEKEEFFNSLIPYFKEEILQKDSTLWEEGSNPNFMYVVEEGQLSVTRISAENNKPEQIERILPLNVVGEMGFFTDNLRRTNLVTITPCVLWVINRFAYARMVGDNPILGFNFMRLTMKLSVERLYDYYKN
ncbi:4029_t:CDS:2, partial [Entrophospora sp. SA101]